MHKCMQRAAGGTIHRLNPGLATVRSRSRKLYAMAACSEALPVLFGYPTWTARGPNTCGLFPTRFLPCSPALLVAAVDSRDDSASGNGGSIKLFSAAIASGYRRMEHARQLSDLATATVSATSAEMMAVEGSRLGNTRPIWWTASGSTIGTDRNCCVRPSASASLS